MDEASLVLPESFAVLGLNEICLKAVAAMGFDAPSPVQQEMIPIALAGRDVLGQARTGTGKTAAFALPIIQLAERGGGTQALILTPTRELAVQVTEEITHLSRFSPVTCVPVYGGTKVGPQIRRLESTPEIVVGTPGRVLDMMGRGFLTLDKIRWAVLDEVDRMLDIGFRDDIRRILGRIRGKTQMMFVSATLPDDVNKLVEEYSSELTRLTLSEDRLTVEEVEQRYITVERWDKYRLLRKVIEGDRPELAIVFTNTKRQTDRVCERLQCDGINARAIHGDLMQRQRDRVMKSFREQDIRLLVATDLMGRGIDVAGISHIINYDTPQNSEIYVHRIGRTARMGAVGMAITFVTPDEGRQLTDIEKLINLQVSQREVEGFVHRPPPPEEAARRELAEKPPPPVERRTADAVFDKGELAEKFGPPPKTLGSAFKTPIRRKLKKLRRR